MDVEDFFFWGGVRYYVSCMECAGQENDFELIPMVKMETRHPEEGYFVMNFLRSVIIVEL